MYEGVVGLSEDFRIETKVFIPWIYAAILTE